jgi:hypothetical protein
MDAMGQLSASGMAAIETLPALLRWRVEETPLAEAGRAEGGWLQADHLWK